MKRILPISIIAVLISGVVIAQAEQKPLLLSEVPSYQIYTSLQLESELQQSSLIDLRQAKSNGLTPLQREFLLYSKLEEMSVNAMTFEDVVRTQKLIKHQPQAYKIHDEGPLPIPVFDIKSLAKYKLYQYDIYQKQRGLQGLIETDPIAFIYHSLGSAVSTEAAKQVIQSLTSKDEPLIDSLVDSLANYNVNAEQKKPQLDLLYTLATKTNNEKAVRAVLQSTLTSPFKSQLLSEIHKNLETYKAEKLLKELVLAKSELSSQAVIQYGKLNAGVKSNDFLTSLLADSTLGSSSALALARLDDEQVLNNVYRLMTKKKASRTLVANGLLVLQQSNLDKAKDLLFDLIEQDEIAYNDMKQEVMLWVK